MCIRDRLDPDANGVGADGLVRDQDGFAIRVYDRYSDRATPVTRLCPHCHNPLPLPNYGKYPTIFISVVGITTCGKTVYLNQLLTRLAMAMQNTGYYITCLLYTSSGSSISQNRSASLGSICGIFQRGSALE